MRKHAKRFGGVEPSSALKARILGLGVDDPFTLEELFKDDRDAASATLDHLRKVARLKVIGVFRVAGEANHSMARRPASAGYVLSGDGSTDQLAAAIGRLMKGSHDFVRPNDLPRLYRQLVEQWRNSLRAQIRYLLLLEAVEELCLAETQLWYFQGDHEWMAAQSLIDEHDRLLREVKGWREPRPQLPRNCRPWHGRPARDRRRAVRPGTSVAYAG